MESIDINQALTKLPELLEKAFAGEEIMITKNNQQQIKIAPCPIPSQRPPLFGCDQGKIALSDDFDEPLDDFQEYM